MPRFSSRRSRYSRRRTTRRPGYRSRPIRRRTTIRRRRPLTRRRILNIASVKKQDNRLTFSNVDTPAVAPTQKDVLIVGGQTYVIPYMPTAMDRSVGGATVPVIPGYRSATEVFMRGYRERISIRSNTPAQWSLRRVCFRFKGNSIVNATSGISPLWHEVSPNGFTRSATNANGTGLGTEIYAQLFKGEPNVDWQNPFTAPIDTNRVTIAYDKQFHFRSHNDTPHTHHFKLWHGMNKKFYYRDDESGEGNNTSVLHTSGARGMGDYYIVDFWVCTTASTDNQLAINYEGTLYWHER